MFLGAMVGLFLGSLIRQPLLGGLLGAWFGATSSQNRGGLLGRMSQSSLSIMSWGLFGFLAGSMLGLGILGLILGLYAGFSVKKKRDQSFFRFDQSSFEGRVDEQSDSFIYVLFYSLGYIAKASGKIKNSDINYAKSCMRRLRYNDDQAAQAMSAFRAGKTQGESLRSVLAKYQLWLLAAPHLRRQLAELMMNYERISGSFNSQQKRDAESFYQFMGYARQHNSGHRGSQYRSYHHNTGGFNREDDGSNAYRELGLKANASVSEIKNAYRKLIAKYHPDRLMSQGLSESDMQKYTEKAKSIQRAYTLLKEQKGF